MTPVTASPLPRAESRRNLLLFALLGFILALRLAQVYFAMLSPISYQPGPDEDYYLRFGMAVASGAGANGAEFTFMDPAYGFVLGGLFKLFGVNLFAVYLLQAVVDTATALAVYLIGRRLDRPRAGIIGAALYGCTATAIMFSTTMLKEIWVTAFLTWWVVAALALIRRERRRAWLAFGLYCGLGIGLRSTLWLAGACALVLPWLRFGGSVRGARPLLQSGLCAAGILVALLPWSVRNESAYGSLSPLPHNGGIVLHQIYNPENPASSIWVPDFVDYLHPSEIWRGYSAEAERRLGRALSPPEVDRYWRAVAVEYIRTHPARIARQIGDKALSFVAGREVPNNRYSAEERLYSPILKLLPAPAPWLIGMGLAGIAWMMFRDRRWPVVAAPVAIAWFTVAVFWAEDRFRFHAMGVLALCAGYWIDQLAATLRERAPVRALGFGALAGLVAGVSLYLGGRDPPAPIRWDHIVWGYIKMGDFTAAETVAERVVAEQPDNAPVLEALGIVAARRQDYAQAAKDLQRAVAIRPRSHVAHYNLARVYLAQGDRAHAEAEAKTAITLNPAADYRNLLAQIERGP
jgi:4-amino-4-deoxy-L-arabinose transferase-like glycosyltransferase